MMINKYYIHRKLKGVVEIAAHSKTILMPEGIDLKEKHQKWIDILTSRFGYVVQKTIPIPTYEFVHFKNTIALKGKKVNFIEAVFFGLRPGNEVLQIGSGKKTAQNSIDKFVEPVKYSGLVCYGPMKLYAFLLPGSMAPDDKTNYYFLYRKIKGRLIRMGTTPDKDKTFLPKFKFN